MFVFAAYVRAVGSHLRCLVRAIVKGGAAPSIIFFCSVFRYLKLSSDLFCAQMFHVEHGRTKARQPLG